MSNWNRYDADASKISRRTMLRGTAVTAFGLATGVTLLSCGDDDDDSATPRTGATATTDAVPSGGELRELSSWPGAQFADAPMWIAQELGWHEDEGIEYSVDFPGSTVRSIQTLVGSGAGITWTDAFGIMVANSQDFPLKSLFMTFQGGGFGFAVAPDSPIQTWDADTVRGTTIGVTEFAGGEVPVLRGALALLNLVEGTDYEIVAVGEGGPESANAIQSGEVDLMAGSVLDFNIIDKSGVPVRIITPDYVQKFPGHSYATTPETLEQNRDTLVSFLRNRAKGVVFTRANPMAAAAIAMQWAEASAEGLTQEDVADFNKVLWVDGNATAFEEGSPDFHKLGFQYNEGWDQYQGFLIDAEAESDDGVILESPVDVSQVVTNDLIDEINDFDYAEIEAIAMEYEA